MSRVKIVWAILLLLSFGVLLAYLSYRFPGALWSTDNRVRFVYGLTLLGVVGSSVIVGWREQKGSAIRYAVTWIVIAVTLVFAYTFQEDLLEFADRTRAAVVPSVPIEDEYGVVTLFRGSDGHFHVNAEVDGKYVEFLVDTGASDVVLTDFDARRLGLDMRALNYNVPYHTANGIVYAAQVTLGEISVGSVSVRNVRASVNSGEMEQSLLGMSFLTRLSSFEVSGKRLRFHD